MDKNGYVYFITSPEYLKVGYSQNPKKRFSAIKNQVPFETRLYGFIPGNRKLEYTILTQLTLKGFRAMGEWFYLHQDVMSYINDILVNKPIVSDSHPWDDRYFLSREVKFIYKRYKMNLIDQVVIESELMKGFYKMGQRHSIEQMKNSIRDRKIDANK